MTHQLAETLKAKRCKSRKGAHKAAIAKAARKVIQLRREHKSIEFALDDLDEIIRKADA